MTWVSAKDTCEAIWEEFEKEYREQIAVLIERAKSEFGDSSLTTVNVFLKAEEIEKCVENFNRIWPRVKETALRRLEKDLLPKGTKPAKMGSVWSRSRKNLKPRAIKGHHPRRKKPGRKARNPHARKHVKTGRPRGWNNAKYLLTSRAGRHNSKKVSEHLAVVRRKKRGLAARLIRTARWSKHLRRYWKAYPAHRASLKNPGKSGVKEAVKKILKKPSKAITDATGRIIKKVFPRRKRKKH